MSVHKMERRLFAVAVDAHVIRVTPSLTEATSLWRRLVMAHESGRTGMTVRFYASSAIEWNEAVPA